MIKRTAGGFEAWWVDSTALAVSKVSVESVYYRQKRTVAANIRVGDLTKMTWAADLFELSNFDGAVRELELRIRQKLESVKAIQEMYKRKWDEVTDEIGDLLQKLNHLPRTATDGK